MKFEIKNRWTGQILVVAEIDGADNTGYGVKVGRAVQWALKRGANLSGADLSGASLRDAGLRSANFSGANFSGADLRRADLREANLREANFSGAYLSGADLREANFSGAYLRGADLRGANFGGADFGNVPVIPNIHLTVYAAAVQPNALEMSTWHARCGTAHCRAGWVVTLAGEAGLSLGSRIGTAAAASMIYLASDPKMEIFPDFYCDNDTALADMKARADGENKTNP